MSYGGGHLGFLIHIKNDDTVRDHPMQFEKMYFI
jgi:hypothetical protein